MNKATRSYNKLSLNKTLISKMSLVSNENKSSSTITWTGTSLDGCNIGM
ncbi:MAG: hypothetical protein ACEPOV_02875 [Hyphomicrobiales bacterium]